MATKIDKTASKVITPKVITPKVNSEFTPIWQLVDVWVKSVNATHAEHALIVKSPKSLVYNPGALAVDVVGQGEFYTGEIIDIHLSPTYTPLAMHIGCYDGAPLVAGGRSPGNTYNDLVSMRKIQGKVELSALASLFIYNKKGNETSADSVGRAVTIGRYLLENKPMPWKSVKLTVTIFPPNKPAYPLHYALKDILAVGQWGIDCLPDIPLNEEAAKISVGSVAKDPIFG